MSWDAFAGAMASLNRRVDDLERRRANQSRVGRVVETDYERGLYRVELDANGSDGRPFLSPWIPRREWAIGQIKMHVPLSVGEQVVVTSENGELVDGAIDGVLPSDANQRASARGGELVITLGETTLTLTETSARLEVGASHLEMTGSKITLRADQVDIVAQGVDFNRG